MSHQPKDPVNQNDKKDHQLEDKILDNLPIAVYTCNRLGYITSFNKAAVKLWGREPKIGEDLWCGSWKIFRVDGKSLSLDLCPMAITLKEGIAVKGEEIIIQRPDGTMRNVLPYPVPTFDASGALTGAVNTLVDVTGQRVDETKQSMLAAIIESSDDAIISKTLDGTITSWNKAAQLMFGYSEEEAVGKNITMIIPADRLYEETFIISKVRNGEKVDHFETIRRTKDNREIHISLTVSPIKDSRGRIIGASKIARDISKQKQDEERLKKHAENLKILNSVGKVIWEDLNVQGILQKVTEATTALTSATYGAFFYNTVNENGEVIKLYSLSGASREDIRTFDITFGAVFDGNGVSRVDDIIKDPIYGENPHLLTFKEYLPVASYLAVPVTAKSGEIIGGLFLGHPQPAIFRDEHEKLVAAIASQATIALDNAKLYEEIKSLNAKKDEFIGLASHELKTPVTSVTGYLQILERSLPDGDSNKGFAKKAIQQIDKLSALIADLLDVSKIQTGHLPLSFSFFDLLPLINEVIEIGKYINRTHTIEVHCDSDQVLVYADKQRIEQVIINLISNAVKYSPNADRVIINVSSEESRTRISIQDFGIGIPENEHKHIFNRFYRVDGLANHISGLGIGLYLSYEIIRRHHGKLWVKSKPGQGATFFVEIPTVQS